LLRAAGFIITIIDLIFIISNGCSSQMLLTTILNPISMSIMSKIRMNWLLSIISIKIWNLFFPLGRNFIKFIHILMTLQKLLKSKIFILISKNKSWWIFFKTYTNIFFQCESTKFKLWHVSIPIYFNKMEHTITLVLRPRVLHFVVSFVLIREALSQDRHGGLQAIR
jgi:hypothetical protein